MCFLYHGVFRRPQFAPVKRKDVNGLAKSRQRKQGDSRRFTAGTDALEIPHTLFSNVPSKSCEAKNDLFLREPTLNSARAELSETLPLVMSFVAAPPRCARPCGKAYSKQFLIQSISGLGGRGPTVHVGASLAMSS